MTEHDKALGSLGLLFSYYNDRYTEADYQVPEVRKRVAISIKLERQRRITKNYFLVPKTAEQIE